MCVVSSGEAPQTARKGSLRPQECFVCFAEREVFCSASRRQKTRLVLFLVVFPFTRKKFMFEYLEQFFERADKF
jgi:hypothetical protein